MVAWDVENREDHKLAADLARRRVSASASISAARCHLFTIQII